MADIRRTVTVRPGPERREGEPAHGVPRRCLAFGKSALSRGPARAYEHRRRAGPSEQAAGTVARIRRQHELPAARPVRVGGAPETDRPPA